MSGSEPSHDSPLPPHPPDLPTPWRLRLPLSRPACPRASPLTAEIAILNLQAVALAADSAVTASLGTNEKVFSSQNKLFSLSDSAPVGILVYGHAHFMSIPWETIVKQYRRARDGETFPLLADYAHDFCTFLSDHIGPSIPEETQDAYALDLVRVLYQEIQGQIESHVTAEISSRLDAQGPSVFEDVSQIRDDVTSAIVSQYSDRSRQAQLVDDLPATFVGALRDTYRSSLRRLRRQIFGDSLSPAVSRRLNNIALRVLSGFLEDVTITSPGLDSGVVLAGFGESELFPSFTEVSIEGVVQSVLKKRYGRKGSVGSGMKAWIVPFAQQDMVYQFMQGIDPLHMDYLYDSMASHLESYTETLLRNFDRYSQEERELISEAVKASHEEIAEAFVQQIDVFGKEEFARQVVDVVAMLPQDQLADMAEALVNLTSLKRKVSFQTETVGGPTDVALITKGDGFIWIKRKHYFSPELNPAYFARRYGKGADDVTKSE